MSATFLIAVTVMSASPYDMRRVPDHTIYQTFRSEQACNERLSRAIVAVRPGHIFGGWAAHPSGETSLCDRVDTSRKP